MSAVTYARMPAAAARETAPRKGLLARLLDRLIEARMEQARREIKLHLSYLPYSLDNPDDRLVKSAAQEMPFGR